MQDQDKDFFILVAGVLAAILLVICWWFTAGAGGVAGAASGSAGAPAAVQPHDEASSSEDDHEPTDAADPAEAAATRVDDEQDEDSPEATDPTTTPVAETEPEPDSENPEDAVDTTPPAASVFDAIDGDERLSVLTDLLRDDGLDAVLVGDGPFTVFAPTNDAVSEAAASDAVVSVLEQSRAEVLGYHVVVGSYTLDDLIDIARSARSAELPSLAGEPLSFTLDGDDVLIDGKAIIGPGALGADNGIVHIVDDVLVPPVAALNTLVDLEPILFSSGSAEIRPASFATLDRLVEVLGSTSTPVVIEGHTDSSGDPLLNRTLSQDRARAVLNYLVANGVAERRLSAIGFGSGEPVADNDTEQGRALNRRIEFSVG